jgi:hypothetical protein
MIAAYHYSFQEQSSVVVAILGTVSCSRSDIPGEKKVSSETSFVDT